MSDRLRDAEPALRKKKREGSQASKCLAIPKKKTHLLLKDGGGEAAQVEESDGGGLRRCTPSSHAWKRINLRDTSEFVQVRNPIQDTLGVGEGEANLALLPNRSRTAGTHDRTEKHLVKQRPKKNP